MAASLSDANVSNINVNTVNLDKFKCNLCNKYMKDPYSTRICSHKFCRTCITNALKENEKCPECSKPLSNDYYGEYIYPDKKIQDEIETLIGLKCFNHDKGCTLKFSLHDLENHENNCVFRCDKTYKCMFYYNGCKQEFTHKNDYKTHLNNSLEEHLFNLLDNMESLKFELQKEKDLNRKLQSKMKREMSEWRLHTQSDRICFEGKVETKIASIKDEIQEIEENLSDQILLHHSGSFIWSIYNFEDDIQESRERSSEDFYVTPGAYKFAIELNVNRKNRIGAFVKIQEHENNEYLSWPFHAEYAITIVHPTLKPEKEFKFGSAIHKFKNPSEDDNAYGWPNCVALQYLKQNGFLLNDTLIVRAIIRKASNQ